MMKKLRYLLLMMLCAVVTGAWAEDPDVTLDFTSQNNWNIPTSGTNKTLASFTDGTYTIKLYSTTNYKMNNGYLILGKKDSYLELPEFSSDVEKIEVVGHSGASGSVGQNIYVGDVAVSTATTGANGVTNVYEIDANYQSAGNVYKLMITTAHNTQIEYIKVYFVADPSDTRTATTVAIDDAGITNTNVFNGTEAGSLSATVMAGETTIDGASVTWSSETESVATIDASTGAVTLVGAGSTVITATYEGDETNYKPSSATYELTVTNTDPNAPVEKWVLVAPEDLQTGDIVAIVDQTSSTAMGNDGGASSAPSAKAVILNTDKDEITSEVASTIQWVVTVSGETTKSYQFGVAGTEDYLYATDTNNGVRVGTNTNNAFTIYVNEGVNFLLNSATSRYIGVYNSQDWRCYTSINNNIKNTVTAFYKKVVEVKADITLDENGGNAAIIAANDGETKTVKVERTLSPDYYNTLYLPFAMSAEQITAAFGDGAQVATFTGTASNGTTFNFQNVTEMAAHKAYLVKPAATVNGFTVEGATIVEEPTIITPSVMGDNYSFDGTLDSYTYKGTAGTPTAVYYFTTSGTVKKLATNGTIKGLRAYMRSTSAISSGSGGGGRAPEEFFISFGDDVTAINAIDGVPVLDANAPIYNLAGQRVGKSYKGVVIQNGKKFVIK